MAVESKYIDRLAIPAALQALNWRVTKSELKWYDGEQLLFAVPIADRADNPNALWGYQIDLVTIHVDDSQANPRALFMVDGNPWSYVPSDTAFYCVVTP